ncbi:MAG: hypothetical protein ABIL49_05215 [candidate division WOR-3 bacterium]|mgnify:CR=1 FL=1
MVLKKLRILILIIIIGVLGILNVWINNVIYYKAKYIDELRDERDVWYIKYMNAISEYYKRRWNYEVKDSFNSGILDSLVSDSNSKIIPHSNNR